MTEIKQQLQWEVQAKQKYELIISKIPLFHRNIAKVVVDKKAVANAIDRQSDQIEEQDIVRAFITEVPMAFYSLMIRLFDEVGFAYKDIEREEKG